jgi:hypothetical protein
MLPLHSTFLKIHVLLRPCTDEWPPLILYLSLTLCCPIVLLTRAAPEREGERRVLRPRTAPQSGVTGPQCAAEGIQFARYGPPITGEELGSPLHATICRWSSSIRRGQASTHRRPSSIHRMWLAITLDDNIFIISSVVHTNYYLLSFVYIFIIWASCSSMLWAGEERDPVHAYERRHIWWCHPRVCKIRTKKAI